MNQEKKPVGRPREHDRDAIAEKLIAWSKLENSLNLNAFCSQNEIPPSNLGIWARECKKFQRAYEIAKSFIAMRREQKLSNGELHVKAYDLNAATYDYFLKEEKREEKAYEAELKKAEENNSKQITVNIMDYSGNKEADIT